MDLKNFMEEMQNLVDENTGFTYNFSVQESKDLVLLLRKYDKELPDSLKDFSISLHRYIYDSMTIEEAENFFYESI